MFKLLESSVAGGLYGLTMRPSQQIPNTREPGPTSIHRRRIPYRESMNQAIRLTAASLIDVQRHEKLEVSSGDDRAVRYVQ